VFRQGTLACAILAAGALGVAGCGKKGPPQPPVRIVPRPAQNVHVRQTGPDVVLEATIALSRSDGSPLGPGSVVRIMRMRASPTLRPASVSARYLMTVFQKEGKNLASVGGADLQRAVATGGRIVYHDKAALGPVSGTGAGTPVEPPARYLYAVQVVDERGERSALSVPQEIQLMPPPPPPVRLKVETAEGEVQLSWESGAPEKPGEIYNVYRRLAAQEEEPLVPLNVAALAERIFVDGKFQYGETYRYAVRALLLPPPPLRESVSSDEVEVRPLDVFPPKAPTGLAAAVEGQAIKLYWFPNSEPDLRGYRIYRREEKGEFLSIGQVEGAETSFADAAVVRGVRYHYAVTAVDGATPPNESPRSQEVSESLSVDSGGPPGVMGR
jgi:hypothetical protein